MREGGTIDVEIRDPEGLQLQHGISGLERTRGPSACTPAYMPIAVLQRVSLSLGRCSSNVLVSTSIPKQVSAVDGPWVYTQQQVHPCLPEFGALVIRSLAPVGSSVHQ